MAHEVMVEVPPRKLGRADCIFQVKEDGSVLGTLTVSKGSIVWFPSHTTFGYKLGWSQFAKLVEENATSEERR